MNHKRILLFLIPSLIVLGLLAFVWGVNLTFLLNPELEIHTISPRTSFSVYNGDSILLEFKTTIDSSKTCSTICSFMLFDALSKEVLFVENKTVDNIYEIEIPHIIYSSFSDTSALQYTTTCYNPVSPICSSTQDAYFETTFITIQHNQTLSQIKKEQQIKESLNIIISHLANTRAVLYKSLDLLSQLNFSSFEEHELENALYSQSTINELHQDQLNIFVNDWNSGLYESMDVSRLLSLEVLSAKSQNAALLLTNNTVTLVHIYEQHILELNNLLSYKNKLLFLQYWHNKSNNTFSKFSIVDMMFDLSNLVFEVQEKNISSIYASLNKSTLLKSHLIDVNNSYYSIQTDAIFSVNQAVKRLIVSNITSISFACNSINSAISHIVSHDISTDIVLQNNYSSLLLNTTFLSLLDNYSSSFYLNVSFNDTSYPYELISPYHINWTKNLLLLKNNYCFEVSNNFSLEMVPELTFAFVNISYPIQQVLPIQIPCCVYGVCSYCNKTISSYPVILVHGHAFSKSASVQTSLHSFTKLQNNLETLGYFNVGELSDYVFADWSELSAPISVRATYYYLSYIDVGLYQLFTKKSESIENYAIRLKEVVDDVKLKSGSDKVVIIAHSMGGLVTRQYLSLFGESSVDKVIFIGTPSNGVIGNANSFCSVVGAQKECEEMAQGSIFLKKLSTYMPYSTTFFTIAGVGCDMGGLDGDGVVTVDSVALPYATNFIINGTCTDTLQTDLHSDLLNPVLYPEVQDIIQNILIG